MTASLISFITTGRRRGAARLFATGARRWPPYGQPPRTLRQGGDRNTHARRRLAVSHAQPPGGSSRSAQSGQRCDPRLRSVTGGVSVGSVRAMTETSPYRHLRLDRHPDGVAVLTLDNPDQRNAMSDEMTASWVAAVEELAADPGLRAVVVTGEGSAFCSGGNTGWIASEPEATVDELRTRMLPFYRAWLSIRRLEVPTIAAVNGHAIGAGLCLALACDIRYAAERAKLGAPFVRLGMHAGMAATHLLPDVVGEAHARDLLLTGRTVDAEEALRLGLVSRVLPG